MEKITGVSMTLIGRQSEQDKIRICKALLHCLKSLHHAGIVHADIKLDNVIFRKLPSGKITGKLIGFDNSFWESQPPAPDEEILGDPVYMAPETFLMMEEEEGRLTSAIDVFALGLVFHQIFTGELPQFNHEEYDYAFEAVLSGEKLIYSREIPELWRNMIIAMTEGEVSRRITLDDAERMWKGQTTVSSNAGSGLFAAAAKATTSSASAPKKVLETPKRSPETPKPEKKSVLISSMPKPGSSGSSSNGQFDNWFSDPGDL